MKMKFVFWGILSLFGLGLFGSENRAQVYFTNEISSASVVRISDFISTEISGKTAIKVHFGEEGNTTFLPPDLVKLLTQKYNATLVETNVLYVGKRRYTESHIELARKHGFDFAPIDILDSDGDMNMPVNLKHYKEVRIGKNMSSYDTFIIFSHVKGHGMAGFGGAIKNVGMGLASVAGKMAIHASTIPRYFPERCKQCRLCVEECPAGAITINPLIIDADKCIGCGKCIGTCPSHSFAVPWGSTDRNSFMERLAEYSKGIIDNFNLVYINVLANITPNCDCYGRPQQAFMDDIGILASTDIVAIEQASYDLIDQAHNCEDTFLKEVKVSGRHQITHAEKLGLGSKDYQLINIDEE